jgi:hypothetical protein
MQDEREEFAATLAPKLHTPLNTQTTALGDDPQKIFATMKSKIQLVSPQEHGGSIGARSWVPETGNDSQLTSHLLSLPGRDIVLILSVDGRIVEANEAAISGYQYDRRKSYGHRSPQPLARPHRA